jgi:hypothetical protein
MNAVSLYFKLAWRLRTPFLFMLDWKYRPVAGLDTLGQMAGGLGLSYENDYSDCDDFAWLFKARAVEQKINGIGFVWGYHHGLHFWNVVYTPEGIYQFEPQNGRHFKNDWHYWPWFAIV